MVGGGGWRLGNKPVTGHYNRTNLKYKTYVSIRL